MKCYYEILDIARDADDGEIKTAYRKLALKWHPDKNLDNSEEAKEQFQFLQQAYEVLSDRQERAWYDNHREQILRGSDSSYQDDSLDVFPYFTTQCFKGYSDDEEGFYTIYRNVFEKIAKEDIEYMDSKSDYDEMPSFGTSSSNYEEIVGPFYGYWMSYNTRKSYVWLDPYNIKETRERRVLKLVEKENKKVRQKAKKERNEEIRNLVAFVRKRDKRIQAYVKQLEIKNAENRQKQELLRKQILLERKKENHTKTQAEWSKFDNVQSELKQIEKNLAAQFGENLSDSEENSEDEECKDLYCAACNKVFKTPKAFTNHESSKKHRENVEKLKTFMLEEEKEFENDVEEEEISSSETEKLSISSDKSNTNKDELLDEIDNFEDSISSESEELNTSSKKKIKKNKKVIKPQDMDAVGKVDDFEINCSISSDPEDTISLASKKKTKKNKKVIGIHEQKNQDDLVMLSKETIAKFEKPKNSDDDFEFGISKKQKKKNKNKTTIKENINKTNSDDTKITENGAETHESTNEITNSKPNEKTSIKLKNPKPNKNKTPINIDDIDTAHVCVTCKFNFNSKNKLFDHLKKTGHSVLLTHQKPTKSKRNVK